MGRSVAEPKLKYERTELIRQLGETMRREAETFKQEQVDYKAACKAWKSEGVAWLRSKIADFQSGELGSLDKYRIGDGPTRPHKPTQPPCRKGDLKMLRAAKDDIIPLTATQYLMLVGSEPCPIQPVD
jgi:hypothetical protein